MIIRSYVVIPFKVYGPSMCNTLNYTNQRCLMAYGDRMIVNIFGYLRIGNFEIGTPKNNDIIILHLMQFPNVFMLKELLDLKVKPFV